MIHTNGRSKISVLVGRNGMKIVRSLGGVYYGRGSKLKDGIQRVGNLVTQK